MNPDEVTTRANQLHDCIGQLIQVTPAASAAAAQQRPLTAQAGNNSVNYRGILIAADPVTFR